MADEAREEVGQQRMRGGRIRLRDSTQGTTRTRKITLVDGTVKDRTASATSESDQADDVVERRKVTPLDSPSM